MTKTIKHTLNIDETFAGQRLDQALASLLPDYSRTLITRWIKEGHVQVNNQLMKPKEKLHGNEQVHIIAPLPQKDTWHAEAQPINIVYEDADLLVINKPLDLVVHPGAGNPSGTLINALLHHYPALQHVTRAGLIHRLDKDTTGLLVVAKTLASHQSLTEQLQTRQIKRVYHAIVQGQVISGGHIDGPIARHPKNRQKMAIHRQGKPAITHYRILKKYPAHTYLHIQLETGRTHQIRVHMQSINHPIVGDPLYGGKQGTHYIAKNSTHQQPLQQYLQTFTRQALHAHQLGLEHPKNKIWMQWQCPLPADMQKLLKLLENDKKLSGTMV